MWHTLEHMANELSLRSDPTDLNAIREELIRLLAASHPDKTKCFFPDENSQANFHRVKSALEFADAASTAMIPVPQLHSLVKSVTETLEKQSGSVTLPLQAIFLQNFSKARRRHHFIPRLTSGAAAANAALFALPSSLASHPFLANWEPPIVSSEQLQPITAMIGLAFILSGTYFLLTWLKEQRESFWAKYIISEQGLREAFFHLLSSPLAENSSGVGEVFSSRDVIKSLQSVNSPSRGLLADTKLAETVSQALLQKFVQRGLIRKMNKPDLDEWYEVSQDIVNRYRSRPKWKRESAKLTWRRIFGFLRIERPPTE